MADGNGAVWWSLFGLGIAGGVFGGSQIAVFERAAAVEIGSNLAGERKTVSVHAVPNGFSCLWGDVQSVTIQAEEFQVDGLPLFTEPSRSKAGRVGTLRIRLKRFDLRGLICAELSADIPNCRFDFALALRARKFRLSKSGFGEGFVRVERDALEKFILKKYQEIETISVELRGGKLIAEGSGTFLFVKSKFFVIADLEPVNGTQIWLSNAKVFLDGVPATEGASRALLQSLNPVIDENRDLNMYGALKMREVIVRDQYVELRGEAHIPEKPR